MTIKPDIEAVDDIFQEGKVVDGFVLGKELHRGGMASLFSATKAGIDLPILLKIPRVGKDQPVESLIGFETSHLTDHKNPAFKLYGVTHYCVPNIASKVPHTASYALSNFLTPILLRMGEEGGIDKVLRSDFGVRQGVYLFNGISTSKFLSDTFHLPFQDINLLMAAFH